MLRVLLTGGGGAGNEALWELFTHRYELHFADVDCANIHPVIPSDRRHQIPWASDPNFFQEVNELCRTLGVDVLIPGVDEELIPLTNGVDLLIPAKLMSPDRSYVETMLDKLVMVQTLGQKGVPVPSTALLAHGFADFNFPCIIKPRKGRGSRGVKIVANKKHAEILLKMLEESAEDYIIQDKIDGTEFTVQMVADDQGRLSAIVPVRVDLKRGITIKAEIEAEPNVMVRCRSIHDAVPTKGCYNIQLILTPEGEVMPFEINPRISTTFCMTVAAGIDPIEIFLGQAQHNDLHPFGTGIQLSRHWVNHFSNVVPL